MKLVIDHHILALENPNIPSIREYTQTVSGYTFSGMDKGIICYHKKTFKIIHLKNLGETMQVFWISEREPLVECAFKKETFEKAFQLFDGFDEESGENYFFLPYFPLGRVEELNTSLERLGMKGILQQTQKGVLVEREGTPKEELETLDEKLSFLFGLVLIYGKLDIKKESLQALKIHIPLFGKFLGMKDFFEHLIKELRGDGLFLSTSWNEQEGKATFQIASTDYEVLAILARWYGRLENITQITKQEQAKEIISDLKDYLVTDAEIPAEGKEEVLRVLELGTVKILTK